MRDAVIVDAVRAPIGRRKGTLKQVHPVDLSAAVLTALAARNQLDPELVEDIVWGCVTQIAEQSTNVGRLAVLAAGWPEAIPGVTLDRACGSSQQAVHFAAAGVIAGHYDIVVAGGVESMSRVPLGSARAVGEPFGPKVKERYQRDSFSQGLGAEDIARRWGLIPHPAGRVRARVAPEGGGRDRRRRLRRPARPGQRPRRRAHGRRGHPAGVPRWRSWRRSSPPSSTTASSTRATARRSPTAARPC